MPEIHGIDHRYFAMGALCATSGVAVYCSFRLWQERKARQQANVYESEKLVNEYLVFHYGSPKEVLRYDFGPKDSLDFPKRCADLCMKYFKEKSSTSLRAFDIGCAVGRSSFELTKVFSEVVGLDYSQAFVDVCDFMKEKGSKPYWIQDEGDLGPNLVAQVPADTDKSRARFIQGDACNLPTDLGKFDCILAANLICRLHHPFDFLNRLAGLVKPQGIVVITSPYTWLEQFTAKSTWLGGYHDNSGKAVTGFDTLKKTLGKDFDLLEDQEMPFFIRETAHKNQWTVAHATVWQRKA